MLPAALSCYLQCSPATSRPQGDVQMSCMELIVSQLSRPEAWTDCVAKMQMKCDRTNLGHSPWEGAHHQRVPPA